jgi:hypothetical protein
MTSYTSSSLSYRRKCNNNAILIIVSESLDYKGISEKWTNFVTDTAGNYVLFFSFTVKLFPQNGQSFSYKENHFPGDYQPI